jgi:hypothetical protein
MAFNLDAMVGKLVQDHSRANQRPVYSPPSAPRGGSRWGGDDTEDAPGRKAPKTKGSGKKPKKVKKPRVELEYSDQAEITRILSNSYEPIHSSRWGTIPLNTYIRYQTDQGILKPGARVKSIRPNQNGGYTIALTKFRGNETRQIIDTSQLRAIYQFVRQPAKPSETKIGPTQSARPAPPTTPMEALGDRLLFPDNEDLIDRLNRVEKRMDAQEKGLRQILQYLRARQKKS